MVSAAYKKAVQGMWKGKATVTVLAGAQPRQWPHGAN